MPINREIDKDVAHIYSGILIRHKKKQNRAICKDVETEEDLDHLKGIQRCCEGKGPTESNTTVQESTKRPEV